MAQEERSYIAIHQARKNGESGSHSMHVACMEDTGNLTQGGRCPGGPKMTSEAFTRKVV